MNQNLKLHIRNLQRQATLSLIAILSAIISIEIAILFLFVPSFWSAIFFLIATACILFLVYSSYTAKKDAKEHIFKPVVFMADKNLSFEEIVSIFEKLTDKENRLCTSENVRFFRLNKIFKLRTVIYRTDNFSKNEYDSEKNRINQKANKELNISQWVSGDKARKMMRFNIICTDVLNDALYQFLSQNTNRNLTRVEGIINIAIVGNQVIIPPIYGECDLKEIKRYKSVIRFIHQFLLGTTAE